MKTTALSEASVYVGTYGKYNNGSLFGAWLDLSDYADKEEFYEACRELHKDEEDAEFMFQDYENIPENLIPGASQGRGRCGIYVSGLREYPGEFDFRKLDFREFLHLAGCGGGFGRHRTGSLFRVVQLQKP